jgi:hypothetical protein
MNELTKLALDAHRGSVDKYSVKDAQETLRQALIEANGGSTKIDYRAIRDGKCPGVFTLVEEILKETVNEGFESNALFDALVEYKNVADGDSPLFDIEDDSLFFIDQISGGNQAIRRQRLGGVTQITLPVNTYGVRIYEELDRILAGRADFNDMIDKVAKSEESMILQQIYDIWNEATYADLNGANGSTIYTAASSTSYSEPTLLTIMEHVEAAAGKVPTLIGTRMAMANLYAGLTNVPESAKEAFLNEGYIGKFYGANVVIVPQRHKIGSTDFAMNDKMITVIASGAKPIKVLREGDPLIIRRDATLNMDLTDEYFLREKWGVGIVMNKNTGVGKYEFT